MTELRKEETLFMRDEEGKLLPQEIVLESLEGKPTIKATPIPIGELQRIYTGIDKDGNTTKNQDADIILKHCIVPKYNEAEIEVMKPKFRGAIVLAIMALSMDLSETDISKAITAKNMIDEQTASIKKN